MNFLEKLEFYCLIFRRTWRGYFFKFFPGGSHICFKRSATKKSIQKPNFLNINQIEKWEYKPFLSSDKFCHFLVKKLCPKTNQLVFQSLNSFTDRRLNNSIMLNHFESCYFYQKRHNWSKVKNYFWGISSKKVISNAPGKNWKHSVIMLYATLKIVVMSVGNTINCQNHGSFRKQYWEDSYIRPDYFGHQYSIIYLESQFFVKD